MTISVFSVIMSILCSSVILFITSLLITHAKRVRWGSILLLCILGFVRLLLPVDFDFGKVIHSWSIYPTLQRIAEWKPIGGWTLARLLIGIWGLGSGICFLVFLNRIAYLKIVIWRAVSVPEGERLKSLLQQVVDTLKYRGNVRIAVTEEIPTAMSVGIISPVILVPKEMLAFQDEEILGILKHEITHYLRGDVGKQWALFVLTCIFWWNPAVHYLKRCIVDMLELECDARVCQGMTDEERLVYLEGIQHTLKGEPKKNIGLGMGFVTSHNARILERRYREALNPVKRYSNTVTALMAVICILVFAASYTVIIQPIIVPEEGEEVAEEHPDAEVEDRFLLRLPNGTYMLISDMKWKAYLTEEEIHRPPYEGLTVYDKEKGE